jgi:hypothetical protein
MERNMTTPVRESISCEFFLDVTYRKMSQYIEEIRREDKAAPPLFKYPPST